MAEIINLRMARKAKTRAVAEQQATENRARFGLTKAEKIKQKREAEREKRNIDAAKRESEDGAAGS